MFGFFAGFYRWFPKATGIMLRERLGKLHFVLLVIGANTTFIPFFFLRERRADQRREPPGGQRAGHGQR